MFSHLDRGGFADFAVVPAQALRRVPETVPTRHATLFEPLGIAVRAVTMAEVAGKTLLAGFGLSRADLSDSAKVSGAGVQAAV